jgi:preprotein translocase subunit SecE
MSTNDQVREPGSEMAVVRWWGNARTFLVEVRNEMRRVTWPSRREVYATTVVVILVSAFFGVYIWGLDLFLSWTVDRIFKAFSAV